MYHDKPNSDHNNSLFTFRVSKTVIIQRKQGRDFLNEGRLYPVVFVHGKTSFVSFRTRVRDLKEQQFQKLKISPCGRNDTGVVFCRVQSPVLEPFPICQGGSTITIRAKAASSN